MGQEFAFTFVARIILRLLPKKIHHFSVHGMHYALLVPLIIAIAFLHSAAVAQSSGKAPGYYVAETAFNRLSTADRYEAQMLLTAGGYWNAVSNEQFSKRMFDAINRYKTGSGRDRNGILDQSDMMRLRSLVAPLLRTWGLRPLAHPRYQATLWVPAGLGLAPVVTERGYQIEDEAKSIRLYFQFIEDADLSGTFQDVRSARVENGFTIDYEVVRSNFFVVGASKPEALTYIRYHAVAGGLIGFAIFVDASRTDISPDRLITLMSDLFRADVQLGEERHPPKPPEGDRLVAWQEPAAGFGQGAIGSMPTAPPPSTRPPDPPPFAPTPSVVVTLPSLEAPRTDASREAALPMQTPEPVKPAPSWKADDRVVELLTQLQYLRLSNPSPSRERLAEVVREFAQDRNMKSPPEGDALLTALRGAAQSETSLASCHVAGLERGAVCLR